MKNKIFKVFGVFALFVFGSVITIFFFPNEMAFKYFYTQENFSQAQKKVSEYSSYSLILQNRMLSKLYEDKNFTQLSEDIQPLLKEECSLDQENISSYCSHIFYLSGLLEYQRGMEYFEKKNLITQDAVSYFKSALFSFQKVMIMTELDSQAYKWSVENIEFLQKKIEEIQQSQQENTQDQAGESSQQQDEKNEKGEQPRKGGQSQSEEKEGQEGGQRKDGEEGEESTQGEQAEGSGTDPESNNDSAEESSTPKNPATESRLPEQIQKDIEKLQKQLEQAQQNSQEGFSRSQSAAEKSRERSQDPFRDPFFQQFFGEDMFHKNIQPSDEKDW